MQKPADQEIKDAEDVIYNPRCNFNDYYALMFLRPAQYDKFLKALSILVMAKKITLDEERMIVKIYSHYHNNYFKIKSLDSIRPRFIAQRFIGKKNVRNLIIGRDKKCLCCGSVEKLQLDHIIPIAKGGENKISNLQTLCLRCNSIKRDKFIDYRQGSRFIILPPNSAKNK